MRWPELMAERPLAGVEHLVSIVEGRCAMTLSLTDLLEATFPGGSVTGAPKISAIDHIAALEPVGRGASMGAFGTIRPNGDLDLALTIRTFAVADGRIHLWVGGGIVWDSDPAAEIEESWVKARPLLAGDRRRGGRAGTRVTLCRRGVRARPRRSDEPVIHVDDEAFMRGRGAFETLRVYCGTPFRLDDHLDRLGASCARLGFRPRPREELEQLAALALDAAAAPEASLRFYATPGRSAPVAVVVVAALPEDLEQQRAVGIRLLAVELPARRPDRRHQVDELRAEHDRRRRRARGGCRRRGVPRRRPHRPRGDDRTSGGGWDNAADARGSSSASSRASPATRSWRLRPPPATPWRRAGSSSTDLAAADEAFTTSSVREVMPVVALDGAQIGDGKPGEAAAALQAALRELACP